MNVIERAGKILIISIVILSVIIIFISFIHHYSKWFWCRRQQTPDTRRSRSRRRVDFSAGYEEQQQHAGVTVIRRGLDPLFLKSIAVIPLDKKDFTEGLECAVCLSEVEEGEKTRVLPKCNHGFHVECIDMWFYSHSTCPICRNPVVSGEEGVLEEKEGTGDFPANILFWGDETQVSGLTSQLEPSASSSSSSSSSSSLSQPDLVIDIPREIDCDEKSPRF